VARKIAVVVGSIRKDSINRKLARALVKLAPKDFECEFVRLDDLPVFNQDHDQNPPEQVARVKAQIVAANALLFVTPEHNRSLPTALKNVLDWVSRPYGKNLWAGKPAGLVGASVGAVLHQGPDRRRRQCEQRRDAQVSSNFHGSLCGLDREDRMIFSLSVDRNSQPFDTDSGCI
jgi:multimeric flavodoxin WrbA